MPEIRRSVCALDCPDTCSLLVTIENGRGTKLRGNPAHPVTRKLRATFENPKGTLFPNQFVNARLLVEEKHGVTLVSSAAVQRNSQATYVYVVKADSTVTVRPITIGTTEGDDSEVASGLTPGEVVVMTGVDKLQEGSKVNAQIPSANSPVSPSVSPPAGASVNPSVKKGGKARKKS